MAAQKSEDAAAAALQAKTDAEKIAAEAAAALASQIKAEEAAAAAQRAQKDAEGKYFVGLKTCFCFCFSYDILYCVFFVFH